MLALSPFIRARLLSVDEHEVRFRWKDYAHHNKRRIMTLSNEEFLRRFLQHILPRGFPRIRYFGWLANRKRGTLLTICRNHLACEAPPAPATVDGEVPAWRCPCCHGPMRIVERLTALQIRREESNRACALDSS
jgi:Putative transposase